MFPKMKFTIFLFAGIITIAASIYWCFRIPTYYSLWPRLGLENIATAINPTDPKLQFAIGDYYFGRGAYDIARAKKYFQTTIVLDERYSRAHYQLSRISFIQGNHNRARWLFGNTFLLW